MERPELYVERAGSGPALVLAHGFGGSARNFRPQQRVFKDRYTVVCYDARGHARSPAPVGPESYTEDALRDDFAGVAREVPGPIVAGGLSLGAYTALLYALGAPDDVRGLVLAAFPSAAASVEGAAWALGLADAIEQRGADAAGAEFVWGEASRFDPRAGELIRRGFLEHPPHALVALLRNVVARFRSPDDLAPELARLDVPVLVIAGANDVHALPPSRRLVELLPDAELALVPDAGHVVNLANPAAFNRALEAFLGRIPASR